MHDRTKCIITALLLTTLLILGTAELISAQTPVNVEPSSLRSDQGGMLSIYATGVLTFNTQYTVRLEGYGILTTQYVNPTALQASVPAGLSSGSYNLKVLNETGIEVGTGSVVIQAAPKPTSTPKPDSPPPAGRPILTIRNYVVEPLQVRPGQEFTVSVEVYNNGSRAGENTIAVFPGGTFLPVGENGHMFWQVHINQTFVATQRMRAPKEIGNGIHNLQVNLSANDWEGNHYDYPQTIAVEIIGASSGATFTGKPELVIEGSKTTPEVITPGSPFTLTLNIANRGSRTAINAGVSADTQVVIPSQGGGIATADTIAIDEVITLTLPLQLKTGHEGGRQGLGITLSSSDYGGGSYSAQQTIGLDIDTSLANRPQLLIKNSTTVPGHISPGDNFTLTLALSNAGGGDAQRLTLALGGEDGENLGVFVPIEGGNVTFIPNIAAGATEEIHIRLLVSGNAETKAHNLPVELAYDTGAGTREKDTQRISIMIRRQPQFKISFYRPVEGVMVGQPFPLPIEAVNTGTARFNIPNLEVTGEGMEFTGETSTYIGQLDAGGSWTLDAMAIATEPGPKDIVVNLHYVDDLNQTQVLSEVLTVEVMEMPDMENMPGPDGMPVGPESMPEGQPESLGGKIGRFFKGLLGLGS